jgi:hypothetical protein
MRAANALMKLKFLSNSFMRVLVSKFRLDARSVYANHMERFSILNNAEQSKKKLGLSTCNCT